MPKQIRSWFVKYGTTDPQRLLLGAVAQSQSSRFGEKVNAEQRLQQIAEVNGSHCEGRVVASYKYPEIFIHCGTIAQCINAKCPKCKKLLTVEDAKRHIPDFRSLQGMANDTH